MPLLADYGNLGENPDSIFSASKRVASYSLDNIAPTGSMDRDYMNAKKSAGDMSLKFLEFKNLVSEIYQNAELIKELAAPTNPDEEYEFIYKIKFLQAALNKANLFFRTYIKPNVSDLDGKEIKELDEIRASLVYYQDFMQNWAYLFVTIDYGNNSWSMLLKTIFEIIEQITITLNSYKQNEPTGLQGAGRNFYGKKINNTRDIPTVYSRSIKNCPTKYLL